MKFDTQRVCRQSSIALSLDNFPAQFPRQATLYFVLAAMPPKQQGEVPIPLIESRAPGVGGNASRKMAFPLQRYLVFPSPAIAVMSGILSAANFKADVSMWVYC